MKKKLKYILLLSFFIPTIYTMHKDQKELYYNKIKEINSSLIEEFKKIENSLNKKIEEFEKHVNEIEKKYSFKGQN